MAPALEPSTRPGPPRPATPSGPASDPELAVSADTPPYARRFRLVLAALLAFAAGALAFAAVLLAGDGTSARHQSSWSSWRPSHRGVAGAREIAARVAPTYRLPNGRQLVFVRGESLSLDLPNGHLPLRILLQSAVPAGNLSSVDGDTVMYVLAGTGPYGAVEPSRKSASVARRVLLRREALELALYSLHDLGVDNVVALLPPPPGARPRQALFFRRRDLRPQLAVPLDHTLPAPPPTLAELAAGPLEAASVLALTDPHAYTFSFTPAQDFSSWMVLTPESQGR